MKKIVITGIAVLFLVACFGYAVAQAPLQPSLGGEFTSFTPKVTFQQTILPKDLATHSDGTKFVNVKVPIRAKSAFDPVLFIQVDPGTGNPTALNVFWKNTATGDHLLVLFCPNPTMIIAEAIVALPDTDSVGVTALRRRETKVDSIQGTANCSFCPNGIQTDINGVPLPGFLCRVEPPSPTPPPTAIASIDFKGKLRENTRTEAPIDLQISGTITGGGFEFVGADFASTVVCVSNFSQLPLETFPCPGLFSATFNARVTPCVPTATDPLGLCQNLYLPVVQP